MNEIPDSLLRKGAFPLSSGVVGPVQYPLLPFLRSRSRFSNKNVTCQANLQHDILIHEVAQHL
jgi:hypothetical protein